MLTALPEVIVKNIGNLLTLQQFKNELLPTYEAANNYMIWWDYAVINQSLVFELIVS